MKKFFSISSLKENIVFYILFSVIALIWCGISYKENINLDYFDLKSLLMAIGVWLFSTLIDPKRYFNVGAMIVCITAPYFIFWFMFNILFYL